MTRRISLHKQDIHLISGDIRVTSSLSAISDVLCHYLIIIIMAKMELCYPEDNCLTQDTIIVLLYAVFCIVFGFVVALLVIWADKRRGKSINITNTDS